MVFFLSEVIENKNLKESDHIAIMFDESTDCTVTEQLVIHCRYIVKDTVELQSQFLKIIDVLGPSGSETSEGDTQRVVSLSADAISACICSYLKDDVKLDMNKIRGIGTDGASTMMGCRNGVVAHFRGFNSTKYSIRRSHKWMADCFTEHTEMYYDSIIIVYIAMCCTFLERGLQNVKKKKTTPSAIGVHCAAHRLNLASSQAGESVP